MKIRCDLHVNGDSRKLLLVAGASETPQHLALKLAAYLLFWDLEPKAESRAEDPALANFEFLPDMLALDDAGDIRLWVECGKVTKHKADKLLKRLPAARLVVLLETEREAKRMRQELADAFAKHERFEVLAFPDGAFREWLAAVGEKTEAYGEAGDLSLNLTLNERPVAVELKRC